MVAELADLALTCCSPRVSVPTASVASDLQHLPLDPAHRCRKLSLIDARS